MQKLLLWDIDGTLISTQQAGRRAVVMALKQVYGIESDLTELEFAGKTDPIIFNKMAERFGLDWEKEKETQFYEIYLESLAQELESCPNMAHHGVGEILEEAHQRLDIIQGLLTGNVARGAEIKLVHFQLWHYFEFGAFGDDGETRNDLGPYALQRAAEKCGVSFLPEKTFVIGDTPHDVACGKVFGAHTIAVATNESSVEELQACEPTAVFADLRDSRAFWEVIDTH